MHSCITGSWKTTRSIGRECTAGDRRSRPVLTAERLDHPDPPPPSPDGRRDRSGEPGIIIRRRPRDPRGTRPRWTLTLPHRPPTELRAWTAPDCIHRGRGGLTAPRPDSGDDTGGAPPVPIPNTAVKPARPMIVPRRESRSSPDPPNP